MIPAGRAILLIVALAVLPFLAVLATGRAFFPRHTGIFQPYSAVAPAGIAGEPANFVLSDKVNLIHPDVHFWLSEIRALRLPVWNPLIFAGCPHLANPLTASASPANLVYLLFGALDGAALVAALHLALAGVFTFLFLRSCNVASIAALLGGTGFFLSGFMAVHAHYGPFIQTICHLPLALFAIERLLADPRGRWAALLALALGLAWLGGFPPLAAYMSVFVAVHAAAGLLARARRRAPAVRRAALLLLAAGLLGAGLAAIQAIPTLRFASDAAAGSPPPRAALAADRLRPAALAGLLSPDLFGHPLWNAGENQNLVAAVLLGEPDSRGVHNVANNYVERTLYPGFPVLLLALLCPFLRRDRVALSLLAAGVISLLFALFVPPFSFLSTLPGFGISAPTRALGIVAFALPALAALSLDAVLRRSAPCPAAVRRTFIVAVLAVLLPLTLWAVAGHVAPGATLRGTIRALQSAGVEETLGMKPRSVDAWCEDLGAHFSEERRNLLLAGLLALPALALVRALLLRPRSPAPAAWLVALLVLDLGIPAVRFNLPVTREGLFAESPGIAFLRSRIGHDRFIRCGPPEDQATFLPPNLGVVHGLSDAQGYRELAPAGYLDLLGRIEGERHVVGVPSIRRPASLASPVLDVLGVRWVISPRPLPVPVPPIYSPAESGPADLWVYERPDAMPRAFVATGRRFVRSPDEAFDLVAAGAAEIRTHALVEGSGPDDRTSVATPAVVLRREGPMIHVACDSPAPGHLVVTDQHLPGWEASVITGATVSSAPVHRTHGAFLAVPVPSGPCEVRLVWRGDRAGPWVSALSLAAIATLLVLPGASRRPAPRESDAHGP